MREHTFIERVNIVNEYISWVFRHPIYYILGKFGITTLNKLGDIFKNKNLADKVCDAWADVQFSWCSSGSIIRFLIFGK